MGFFKFRDDQQPHRYQKPHADPISDYYKRVLSHPGEKLPFTDPISRKPTYHDGIASLTNTHQSGDTPLSHEEQKTRARAYYDQLITETQLEIKNLHNLIEYWAQQKVTLQKQSD